VSNRKKIVIVGGVAGGASAAARLRRLDEHADIILLERDEYISFANCGLPYYLGKAIEQRDKLILQTPQAMAKRFRLDIRTKSNVTGVDTERKVVRIESAEHGSYEESYDTLILSPGAKPLRPAIPGLDSSLIYTLRNLRDTDRIKAKLNDEAKSVVIVGGGFIGVEMAENLREAGLEVTLIEAGNQVLAQFDAEMATPLTEEMISHGIRFVFADGVKQFREQEIEQRTVIWTVLQSGQEIVADLVIFAIGVSPDVTFLHNTEIALGPRGHILVNTDMQTSVPDIYAVGDAVEVVDFVHQHKTAVPLAGPANKQGRIVADRISGLGGGYAGTQGTSILKVFGKVGATTGSNEKTLLRLGVSYHAIYVHPQSHASYYPGARPMSLKLLFGDQGQIYGAQIVGDEGVDKRIDIIATVMRLNGTIYDLSRLELAYAPPFSSAKDPVNMAGFVAENVLQGITDVITPADVISNQDHKIQLVDVRTLKEHNDGHIPGSLHIPVDDLRERMAELDEERDVWVYCQVGMRGHIASRILIQHGYQVKNVTGGYKAYRMFVGN
jgi:NADPH-dependent 2,4-dienoyl-CoA reductase/sulfur reductase-like enzyme/rhodanese-related sulfurtransferase